MDRAALLQRLQGYEWRDVEFKACRRGVSQDAYKTVSAFANTAGGWLVLGVEERDGEYRPAGVEEVDRVQNEFLSALRSGKFNRPVTVNASAIEVESRTLLVFQIPEAPIHQKPVHLGRDLQETYLRSGAGDERVTPDELRRLLADAEGRQRDAQVVDTDPATSFDPQTIARYRAAQVRLTPGEEADRPALDWLRDGGLVVESHGRLRPTVASILLFGTRAQVNSLLPRPVVDFQRIDQLFQEELPDPRWNDRALCECNLLTAWWTLLDRFHAQAERPFALDPNSLERRDLPPDYLTFREAAVNLLVHQDFADHAQWASIHLWRNRWIFANPGLPLPRQEELLEPGPKRTRNPMMLAAFRRIGLSDQGGTGLRAIYGNVRRLSYPLPELSWDRTCNRFALTIAKEALVSPEQALFQAQLGVHLTDDQARIFAALCRQGSLLLNEARALLGCTGDEARSQFNRLTTQGLITVVATAPLTIRLAEHLRDRWDLMRRGAAARLEGETPRTPGAVVPQSGPSAQPIPSLVTDQANPGTAPGLTNLPASLLTNLSEAQLTILRRSSTPQTRDQLQAVTGHKHRNHFVRQHFRPLIEHGLIALATPMKATDPRATYLLTEAGLRLLRALPQPPPATEAD